MFLQFQYIVVQLIGIFFYFFDVVIVKQCFFQMVEIGKFWIFCFFFEVVFVGVDVVVKVREQFGNGFDVFVMLMCWGVQCFCFFDIVGFYCVGKGFGVVNQLCGFCCYIGFIGGDCVVEVQYCICFCCVFGGGVGDDQFVFWVGEQVIGYVIFVWLQVCGEFLSKVWCDVFVFFYYYYFFQNFLFQCFLVVVLNNKLGFICVNGYLYWFVLFVVDGDFDLWDICSLCIECRVEQCGYGYLQCIMVKMNYYDYFFW